MTDIIPQRTCTKCKQSFPQTLEFFSPDKSNKKIGLKASCKRCQCESALRHYEANRQKVLDRLKKHRVDNPEVYAEREKQRYQNNPEREKARWADYRQRNHETVLARTQDWRRRNPNHIKAYSRKYHQDHLEVQRAKSRDYYRAHYEERILYSKSHTAKRRLQEKAQGDGYTAADVRLQHLSQHGKCWHCFKPVGKRYHIDHLIPLKKGGKHDASNIVISCPLCNLSKKDKLCYRWNGRLF